MKKYQYKILGKWVGPVKPERIRELVTNGTLNPYDFIRKNLAEDGKDPQWKKFMIRKHVDEEFSKEEEFKDIDQDWTKLLSVRTKLDQLWKTQRDSLLAKITGTEAEAELNGLRRKNDFSEKAEGECLSYWRNEPDGLKDKNDECKGALNIEIRKRIGGGLPGKCLPGLNHSSIGEAMDPVAYDSKKNEVRNWLEKNGLDHPGGVYLFERNGDLLYVGQTTSGINSGFGERIVNGHFQQEKTNPIKNSKCHECDTITIYPVNNGVGTGPEQTRTWDLEKMFIRKQKGRDNDYDGTLNSKKSDGDNNYINPIEKILSFLKTEIEDLCKDEELLG